MALGLLRRRWSKDAPARTAGLTLPVPPGAGGLARTVLDPVDQPLGGADVTVTALDSHQVAARGTTDPFGFFMAALPPGRYSMLIAAEGLEPHRETVEIVADASPEPGHIRLMPARQLPLPPTGGWVFDPPHTAIRFIAKHVGMAHVHGRFERFDGAIDVAPDMSRSTVRVYRGGSKWTLLGSLTMHGVSRSVSLDTTYLGTVNGGYGEELRCAALATAELHREDYTLNWRSMLARGIAVVGPTVQLELDVQAMYRSPDTPTPPE
ncbi:YceI family protein [Streptomyces sp. NPDC007851]|uniref:YceI family protein n=1 Tax=Streptomyces sp. NPDC007851 TaxID=3155008 RepID=UPI0034062808